MIPGAAAGALQLWGLTAVTAAALSTHGRVPLVLAVPGLMLLGGGAALQLLAITAPLAARLDESLLQLALDYAVTTDNGRLILVRALAAAAGVLLLVGPGVRRAARPAHAALLLLLLIVAWAVAVDGHAAAAPGGDQVVWWQTVHVILGVSWAGLVLRLLWEGEPPAVLHRTLARVGNIALAAVLLLLVGGAWLAWLHGLRPHHLLASDYGLALLFKLVCLGVALAAAAGNRLHALALGPARHPLLARRLLWLEAAALALLLVAAAVLAATPPPH